MFELARDALTSQAAPDRQLFQREPIERLLADPNRQRTTLVSNTLADRTIKAVAAGNGAIVTACAYLALVEVHETTRPGGPVTRGLGDTKVTERAGHSFEDAVHRVEPAT